MTPARITQRRLHLVQPIDGKTDRTQQMIDAIITKAPARRRRTAVHAVICIVHLRQHPGTRIMRPDEPPQDRQPRRNLPALMVLPAIPGWDLLTGRPGRMRRDLPCRRGSRQGRWRHRAG